jgi:hypothetical protein
MTQRLNLAHRLLELLLSTEPAELRLSAVTPHVLSEARLRRRMEVKGGLLVVASCGIVRVGASD